MFSSNSTTDNPFPLEVYPSFHVSPPYFLGQNISLHHNSQDLSPGELFPANVPVTEPCSNTGTPDTNCVNANHFETLDPGKKPVRKDRHSKICTAQGTRDRRVRLSIDIAREFFDLQDMLGFDKASRTIDWLLAKSKNAITELVQLKRSSSGDLRSLSSLSELCEIAASVDKEDQTAEFDISAKESRANARARARARTKEKMRIRKIYQSEKVVDLSPNTPEQSSSWNPFEPQLPYIHQAGIIIPESRCVENSNKAALMNDD